MKVYSAKYAIKDCGQRQSFSSGMVRDAVTDKVNVALAFDGPMLLRWARHLTLSAVKYTKRNWMMASGPEEFERFRESAARHFEQWMHGETDEDHAAAVLFNINGAEYVTDRLRRAEAGSESARSAGPELLASQSSDLLLDPHLGVKVPPQMMIKWIEQLQALVPSPSHEIERHTPDLCGEDHPAPSADRQPPMSVLSHSQE